jgi:hypothetical protein
MGAAVRHHPRAGLVTVKGYPTDWLTSALGHSRPNWAVGTMSGLTPSATELRTSLMVWFV